MGETWATFWLIFFIIGSIYSILFLFKNYFSYHDPLSIYPGPFVWKWSRLPQVWYLFRGTLPWKIHQLHEKYGPVVRVAPNELLYTTVEAWNDIYGRGEGRTQLRKDLSFAPSQASKKSGANGLMFELDDNEHARLRRNVSHAFSAPNLRAQEPIIMKYTDQFIDLLKARRDQVVNMTEMFNFLLFDITGDMTFGDSFNSLRNATLHPWIKFIFGRVAGAALLGAAQKFWPFTFLFIPFIHKWFRDGDMKHYALAKERLDKRLENLDPQTDFISHLQKNLGKENGLSYAELVETSRVLIVGGAETTATLLTGLLYYLRSYSGASAEASLTTDIRTAFSSSDKITLSSLQKIPSYNNNKITELDACINEGLRLFPPLPGNLRRIVGEGGKWISGKYVWPGTLVAVDILAANLSSANFHLPNEFRPERWMGYTAEFAEDKLDVVQPFSFGPRNCIGKNLALMEMRLILAKLLWHFDIELEEESRDWISRVKACGFFIKPKLVVKLRDANGQLEFSEEFRDSGGEEENMVEE